ncbi:hypothetical protein [Paenibacillus polysaccharolyticus]|uniref:hypothetical protein n=1 Tax=Paenibacillus polysaccharolyticus TaxID=582692 RepID=UPI00300AA16E
MSDKVKLTKQQAASLESFTRLDSFNADEFLIKFISAGFYDPENECLNNLTATQLARCLLIGYEVALSEEEQLLEAYKECPVVNGGRWAQSENVAAFRDGMTTAMNILGKKVPGINE